VTSSEAVASSKSSSRYNRRRNLQQWRKERGRAFATSGNTSSTGQGKESEPLQQVT